eukprot:gnl/TRDRNA2_/TRDRNA2_165749_c4_seq1.p1 gnl/TRDRNA2_/TRDRNA2_165749_c4~~gnl/TRDRNA2_/TRDRNA2_165749_c4_seq1.p1  ORF type:complete len:309 (-),score=33.67 gnl/TRDRNA2_/TRDRNA2_165749_c4_seq1:101-976(-)
MAATILAEFVEGNLGLLLAPLADPHKLTSLVSVCAAWRRQIACAVAKAGGAKPWLSGPFPNALEADSFDLCRRTVESAWFDQRHYVVAMIVVVKPDQHPLERTLQLLGQLPSFVPVPPPDLCDIWHVVSDGEADGWVHTVVHTALERGEEASMAQELRRQWASAYLLSEDGSEEQVRTLCSDALARWQSLWSCARCGSASVTVTNSSSLLRHPSLRGIEWWKADILTLGPARWELPLEPETSQGLEEQSETILGPELSEMAQSSKLASSDAELGGSVSAVCFTYWEKRLLG